MSDLFKRYLGVLSILLILLWPALVPDFAMLFAFIFWTGVVVWAKYTSIGFDLAQSVPIDVASHLYNNVGTVLLVTFFAGLLLNGLRGAIAMVMVWWPATFYMLIFVSMGIAVQWPGGWTGYLEDNYTSSCKEGYYKTDKLDSNGHVITNFGKLCRYTPKPGHRLASFTMDVFDDNLPVTDLVPYDGVKTDSTTSKESKQPDETPGKPHDSADGYSIKKFQGKTVETYNGCTKTTISDDIAIKCSPR